MNRIQIPAQLDARLGDSALAHAVRLYGEQIENWVGDDTKGLFFFPEYTDHGPKHITSVLAGAEALIREETWDVFAPEDAAVLVLATLLHDSAMHLTADGLMDLLEPAHVSRRPLIHLLDDKTWPQLFADFFAEARRWDQRKLRKILGDESVPEEEAEDLIDYIRRPAPMGEPWPEPYRKFVGEFLRRYHARLAHEIALYGVPGDNQGTLKPQQELDAIADLAGIVARSHNMQIRQTFDYLEQRHWGRVTCQGTHPVFLMALLRIADYLEFRSGRTNPTLRNLQHLRSPLSREEHDAHRAVHEIRPDEHDEEAVFVIARPKSARLFLKLRDLLASLQEEIDTSWAVLGEVFSRQGGLSRLGITLRRVRSNIDYPKKFVERENPSYIPIRACFDTAGADLLKLLVRPLYGDRPDIGVRELLQNALDAVRERRFWDLAHGGAEIEPRFCLRQEADVVISIDTDERGNAWLTVSDKGIGMTAEVVRDYFLKAGASYRQSDAWRQEFEFEGRSKVLRSGRFGIGALAAFLLGPRFELLTRHVTTNPQDGICLRASIADDLLELNRGEQTEPGTMIRIPLNQSVASRLRNPHLWDWYILDDPILERSLDGSICEPQYKIAITADTAPNDWRHVRQPYYQNVFWTYSSAPALTCNGIVVQHRTHKSLLPPWRLLSGGFLDFPNICVFDPDGKLPLRLARDRLEERLPCIPELAESVAKDFLAWLLTRPSHDLFSFNHFVRPSWFGNKVTAIKRTDCLLVEPKGFTVCHPWFIKKAAIDKFIIVVGPGKPITEIPVMRVTGKTSALLSQLSDGEIGGIRPSKSASTEWYGLRKNGEIDKIYDQVKRGGGKDVSGMIEWQINLANVRVIESALTRLLDEFMDCPIIPFDPAERRAKFTKAFDVLREYIETWERPDLAGWRKEMVDLPPETGAT